jgi:hypothetical protein
MKLQSRFKDHEKRREMKEVFLVAGHQLPDAGKVF